MPEEIYRACQWCKWYNGGFCENSVFSDVDLHPFWEDGQLASAVDKGLQSIAALKSSLSVEALEALEEELNASITDALSDFEGTLADKTGIADPTTFCCKEFWE